MIREKKEKKKTKMNNRMLQRGIELTTKAAQLDQQGNYAAALKQYELSLIHI